MQHDLLLMLAGYKEKINMSTPSWEGQFKSKWFQVKE